MGSVQLKKGKVNAMKRMVRTSCCLATVAGLAFGAATELRGATLTLDKVEQRYPWNGIVDIDYTITLGEGETLSPGDDAVEITVTDQSVEPARTFVPYALSKVPLPIEAGTHRFTWDAKTDKVVFKSDSVKVEAKLRHYPAVYMVIDVSEGSTADYFPVDYYDGVPPGDGFNQDEYKGDKIVLRRIRPGSYMAGSPTTEVDRKTDGREVQHRVTLTKGFYIGVFETTQKQYKNVMGSVPTDSFAGDYRPVGKMDYDVIRGSGWPTTKPVASGTFMKVLLDKCKSKDSSGNYTIPVTGFDLPLEFQWEFACRAGTTTATYTGVDVKTEAALKTEVKKIARYSGNVPTSGYTSGPNKVGSYQPNDYGLYDMIGNRWEWCRDWYKTSIETEKQYVDPEGPKNQDSRRCARGSYFGDDVTFQRSASRTGRANDKHEAFTFRIVCELP